MNARHLLFSCPALRSLPLALATAGLLSTPFVWAQQSEPVQKPVFVTGDRIDGQTDVRAVVEGNAELIQDNTTLHADRVEYTVETDTAHAQGNVRIVRDGNEYRGTNLVMRVNAFEGFFDDVTYQFLNNAAHGEARRVDFIDRDHAVIHDATYTTCQRDGQSGWKAAWVLRADKLRLDQEKEEGWAEGAVLEFQGVPVLPIPRLSFPLTDKRKSGLLPPSIGLDSRNGFEYIQPYYWNIAPNYDATLEAGLMLKRGLRLGGEFRYLQPNFSGQIGGLVMPDDRLRNATRWSLSAQHGGRIPTALGDVGISWNLNRVSDDNYWRDFSARGQQRQLTERLLPADLVMNWDRGDFGVRLRTLKWQTLQDAQAPIIPPYDRLPQLQLRYAPSELTGGLELRVEADTTRFQADRWRTGQPNAQRSFVQTQLSRPFVWPEGFITPKVQLHSTYYHFDDALRTGQRDASRVLPTVSLDSGLVFERDAVFGGRNFTQTLEPRLFYTYTPYRNQSHLPLYDTAPYDFSFASIYTENAFGGHDRIADNNLLTLGVSTRLLDADSGEEAARFGVAQRLRFSDQKVALSGNVPNEERLSDLLVGAGLQWTPEWGTDAVMQFNPKTRRSIRSTIGVRYNPGPFRTVSAAYRLQRGTSEQMDFGWQWPIAGEVSGSGRRGMGQGRWYSVGRLNYSMPERRLVDTVVGFEYDSCCWIGRVVYERLQSGVTHSSSRLLFQIEFVGFSRLSFGSNPLNSLQQNIPGYRYLREEVSSPSPFSN